MQKVYTYNETLCCSKKSSIGKWLEEIALQHGCRLIIWSQWLALKKAVKMKHNCILSLEDDENDPRYQVMAKREILNTLG